MNEINCLKSINLKEYRRFTNPKVSYFTHVKLKATIRQRNTDIKEHNIVTTIRTVKH